MSFATGFVRFRAWQVKGDTIPKPVGLGSRGPREAGSIRCAFIEYSMNIRRLFNVCSVLLATDMLRLGTF
jgi:hypothetical protein